MKRRICVVIGSRANYSSIKSAMIAIHQHKDLELQLVVGASALLDRYGSVIEVIQADGFVPDATAHIIIEGSNPTTMAKSTGLGLLELPMIFNHLKPDTVITVGDRFETIATAIAATYMNIPLAHTMGGEISGNIDESIRHAITKLAHIHFPANKQSAQRIIRMGEDPKTVYTVGCPRIDVVTEIAENNDKYVGKEILQDGVGADFSLNEPFLLVSQHPVTTEYGSGERQITETLISLQKLQMPTIILWPNVDAGSDDVARGIRKFREKYPHAYIHFLKNLPFEIYIGLMIRCSCIVGNSSSAIREGAFLGTPAVNIGSRQAGRERGNNIINVNYDREQITEAIKAQIRNGKYPSEHIYGDGQAGERIANILATCEFKIQKRIVY